ncbi:hypothetical protein KUV85_00845 [Nocardioides panacisoli]|uniref:hypothetical protein n=1 Tax=Nocardioides panacisoli TaxID=627624 RepID=UPI001C636BA5|nr:hypothetical protein [Nocardioides panacisoli]QYJ04261.1 hypothetical protein KUV85_00845 [Nocardioides panacisoli]
MTWQTFHHRGDVLRAVIDAAEARRDGELPMDVDGVDETFRDELDLLAALSLKWHTRLSGKVHRALEGEPLDLEDAVCRGWSAAATELGGVRLILDNYRDHPVDYAMAGAMLKSTNKERQLLAVLAGRAGLGRATSPDADPAAVRIGAEIEERARELHRVTPVVPVVRRRRFVDLLREALAA